jgi:hypothetical protein
LLPWPAIGITCATANGSSTAHTACQAKAVCDHSSDSIAKIAMRRRRRWRSGFMRSGR